MKSILAQLAEYKEAGKALVDEMLRSCEALDEYENLHHYPIMGTLEERIAYVDKRDAVKAVKEKAEKKAKAKVIAFGELMGLKVKFGVWVCPREIKEKYYYLVNYCEELEYRANRVIETYNEYNH